MGGRGNPEIVGFRQLPLDGSVCRVRLPRPTLLGQFLSAKDVAFVTHLRSPEILRLLLQERQRLARAWLRMTRQEAGRLYRVHVHAARHTADLRPAVEAELFVEVCVFWIVYKLLCVMVRFYGYFRTQIFLGSVQRLGTFLSGLGGRIANTATRGVDRPARLPALD